MSQPNKEKRGIGMPEIETVAEGSASPTCGIIMPLSAIDGCSPSHWGDVQAIIKESVEVIANPKFSARMVSDADDVGVIQKRIVSNIYLSDVVVCDVSGKNPNVMFELGMRLAFDRPAVIIKDDKTSYSFDTGVIEHLTYPRDLRYTTMQSFKQQLADKVVSTYQKSKDDPAHSTFLKNFGTFKVANLHTEEVRSDELLMSTMEQIQAQMQRLTNKVDRIGFGGSESVLSAARRLIKRERETMGEDSWLRARSDESFAKYIAENLRREYPQRDVDAVVDRAMRMVAEQ
ncbi:hypothetical protein [Paraburkholderia bannensis]|uniref:hypothetical protein n=1 Tax=Paraburkholderia bannensis TaxID=765414 RepID=UPI0012EC7F82|nr:hypothetical protein [Paraburkholderia bannensis]